MVSPKKRAGLHPKDQRYVRHACAQIAGFMLFVMFYYGEVSRKNLERIAGEGWKKPDSDGNSTKKVGYSVDNLVKNTIPRVAQNDTVSIWAT